MKKLLTALLATAALLPAVSFADNAPRFLCTSADSNTTRIIFSDNELISGQTASVVEQIDGKLSKISIHVSIPDKENSSKIIVNSLENKDKPGTGETFNCLDLSRVHI